MVPVKGVHVVKSNGRTYVYAWRGGPRLQAQLGTPEFFQELAEITAKTTAPDSRKILGLVADYRGSDDWKRLAEKSRKNWQPFLDSICDTFGSTSIAAFDRPLVRVAIRQWRDRYKNTPPKRSCGLCDWPA